MTNDQFMGLVRKYGNARAGKALHNGDAQRVSCDTSLSAVEDALLSIRARCDELERERGCRICQRPGRSMRQRERRAERRAKKCE